MTELEQELLKLVTDLRSENSALFEVILNQQNLLPKETPVNMTDIQAQGVGKTPWYIRQQKLTKLFRVSKEEVQDAS